MLFSAISLPTCLAPRPLFRGANRRGKQNKISFLRSPLLVGLGLGLALALGGCKPENATIDADTNELAQVVPDKVPYNLEVKKSPENPKNQTFYVSGNFRPRSVNFMKGSALFNVTGLDLYHNHEMAHSQQIAPAFLNQGTMHHQMTMIYINPLRQSLHVTPAGVVAIGESGAELALPYPDLFTFYAQGVFHADAVDFPVVLMLLPDEAKPNSDFILPNDTAEILSLTPETVTVRIEPTVLRMKVEKNPSGRFVPVPSFLPAEDFVKIWEQKGTKKSPPAGTLFYYDPVERKHMALNVSFDTQPLIAQDAAGKHLIFNLRLLPDRTADGTLLPVAPPDLFKEGHVLRNSVLFVDGEKGGGMGWG